MMNNIFTEIKDKYAQILSPIPKKHPPSTTDEVTLLFILICTLTDTVIHTQPSLCSLIMVLFKYPNFIL